MTTSIKIVLSSLFISVVLLIISIIDNFSKDAIGVAIFCCFLVLVNCISAILLYHHKRTGFYAYFGLSILYLLTATTGLLSPFILLIQAMMAFLLAKEFRSKN